ncbi:SPOR domain-containing protein [Moritella sp.]|uniref:SPOR domain-containing protein n=1 Tax=Moritella sp. TaxID=78556 RepID=UPI001DE1346A|nr:SPOR domain-containing protein [Moritella sp.]MCJ8352123.1 SPOR domain-containing protein [Moritella sp.]NQZ42277.1 SPOR domain-containing protein [Moritella sp.]
MARKDYAGHAPKPRKKRGAKKAPPAKKKRPVLAILLFLMLAIGLGYFLAQVSGTAEEAEPVKKTPPKKLTVKPLPEKPKEQWQYPQDLQEKEVIVEIPPQQDTGIRYQMQCGSFRQRSQAESMKATIAFQGYTANIRHTGNWYRVVLGPYERKRIAEKQRHQIKRAGVTTCEIWQWKP